MSRTFGNLCLALLVAGSLVSCGPPDESLRSDSAKETAQTLDPSMSKKPKLGLFLHVHPLTYGSPDALSVEIYFENLGEDPMVILPSLLHRQYRPLEDGAASYIPGPNGGMLPWQGAFVLGPLELKKVELMGMGARDGLWELDPGAYGLSVRYLVEEDLVAEPSFLLKNSNLGEVPIWVGDVQSREIIVRYKPTAQMSYAPMSTKIEKAKSGGVSP